MVKHSLRNMIEKYPYFFDKRPVSNFYKITKVYNKNFQLMYNDLYNVYEGFHLFKKGWIWKEQSAPYEYQIHFVANFPSLKSVKIYKNDSLIYKRSYKEDSSENLINDSDIYDEAYTLSEDSNGENNRFDYTYYCKYVQNNALQLYAYQCTECGALYFNYNLPRNCVEVLQDGSVCENTRYVPVKVYKCTECDEIYFSQDEIYDCNEHEGSLVEVNIYECLNCGAVYFGVEPPEECSYCFEDEEHTIPTRMNIPVSSELHYTDAYSIVDNSEDYTEYGDYFLKVSLIDVEGNPLPHGEVSLICNNNVYKMSTNAEGVCIIPNLIKGEYTFDVVLKGYALSEEDITSITIPDTDEINLTLVKSEDEGVDNVGYVDIAIPPIPDDRFLMVVETYDEYELVKGFPENDYTYSEYNHLLKTNNLTPNAYDHDYSLDMIGALNRIPRKEYVLVSDDSEYPFTEPPYNNRFTEDDYHYMKRMIEYNLRLWYMNPPSLELWKIYGIDSELINRERYLLKVFDENKHPFDESTGLVKCWTPEKWEHKDKFCDGSTILGEYFFVTSNTTRPIKGENVDFTFQVLNSLAEPIEEEFYVKAYKRVVKSNDTVEWVPLYGDDEPITNTHFRLSYKSINVDEPTVLCFRAYHTTGEQFSEVKTIINLRNEADFYVDTSKSVDPNYVGDGSKEHPFTTLQEALNKVNRSLNYICLLDDVVLYEPLIINYDTIIVGQDKFTDVNDPDTRYVPKIYQRGINVINSHNMRYRTDFFKITGNKNCKLILSNLRLVSGQLNSFIPLRYWVNSNNKTGSLENVIITGGTINLEIDTNQESFYPYDYVDYTIRLTKKDGSVLSNNTVEVYKGNELIESLVTDSEGLCNFKYNLDESDTGDFYLQVINKSDVFFESNVTAKIVADKVPHYYSPGVDEGNNDVELDITHYEIGDTFKLYSKDDGLVDEITISSDEDLKYQINDIPFGKYVYYSTLDNAQDSSVEEEWFVESVLDLTDIGSNVTFAKNLELVNGIISFEEVVLNEESTFGDLDGVVLNVGLTEDNKKMVVDVFKVAPHKREEVVISYSDAMILKDAVVNLSFDMSTGKLKGSKLGEFW